MNHSQKKSIFVIYPPRDKAVRTIHEKLCKELENLGFEVDKLNLENPPPFKNTELYDKFRNIYERKFRKNNTYIFEAEKKFYNKYFYSKLLAFESEKNKQYNYILVIKPEEFSPKFIKKLSAFGDELVGYMWDALRLHLKSGLLDSKKYFHRLYSFDKNNIKDHPELELKFLTNYYIPDHHSFKKYEDREIDVFYVGALAGTLPHQRRDFKLANLAKVLKGNIDIKIHVDENFLVKNDNLVNDNKIGYITESTTIEESLEKTKNARVIIDICKNQHIGLSFRFFEALVYENKILTNNADVVNYDFYHPDNIMVVDFDNLDLDEKAWLKFQNLPYRKIPSEIIEKYSLENWIKNVFQFGTYIPI